MTYLPARVSHQCHNRVMFKQLLQASALQFVQIDSCRVGSVNENLAVMLMAHKFQGTKMYVHKHAFIGTTTILLTFYFPVPVCPHAGGVGLCELVQHLILYDYICISANLSCRYDIQLFLTPLRLVCALETSYTLPATECAST